MYCGVPSTWPVAVSLAKSAASAAAAEALLMPEVDDLRDGRAAALAAVEDDVRGLQVAVDDAARVERGEAAGELERDHGGGAPGEAGRAREAVGERLAGEAVEDEVEVPVVGLAEVAHADDVLVLHPLEQARLLLEAVAHLGAPAGALHRHRLDGDALPAPAIDRLPDRGVRALGDPAEDLVAIREDETRLHAGLGSTGPRRLGDALRGGARLGAALAARRSGGRSTPM